MPVLTGGWNLEGGFSHLVEGTSLELLLRADSANLDLDIPPVEFLRKRQGATLTFQAKRALRGYLPKRVSWRIEPDARIIAKLLRPGNAYLGNFRIPKEQFGLQWTVSGKVTATSARRVSDVLFNFRSGSRVTFAWVEVFDGEWTVREALLATWTGFRDPFEAREIALMRPAQVSQFSWSGSAQIRLSAGWDLARGWELGAESEPWFDVAAGLRADMGLDARYTWRRSGDFSLRWSNRRGALSLSLRRNSGWDRSASIEVALGAASRTRVKSPHALLDPAFKPLRDKVKDGLVRRAEILLAAEVARWRRRKEWVKASWKLPLPPGFTGSCSRLLEGRISEVGSGVKVTSALETLRGRRARLSLNFLNWLSLGIERITEESERFELDPMGNLLMERNLNVEKRRWRGENLRFLRLLATAGPDSPVRWVFGTEGALEREQSLRVLKAAQSFGVQSPGRQPAEAEAANGSRIVWGTEFSSAAIDRIRNSSERARWDALVLALELSEPDRYGSDSYWRDWIESRELREIVDREPLQAHLRNHYPLPGRSEIQRRQAVSEYRRFRSFLRFLDRWAGSGKTELPAGDDLEQLLEVPIFYFFHALCPPETRTSFLLMTGEREQFWGDEQLLSEMLEG